MSRASPRPAGEVRRLMLEAATQLFTERGYARTTTRAITQRAGVTPYQLFAQFGSKARLFEIATVEQYCTLVRAYVEHWQSEPPLQHDVAELCREILSGLFDVFEARQGLVAALVIAHAHEDDLAEQLAPGLATVGQVLRPLEQLTEQESTRRGYAGTDPALLTRLTHGAVLATSLFRPWLGDAGPTREAEIDAMTDLMLHGLLDAPEPDEPGRRATPARSADATGTGGSRPPARTRVIQAAAQLFQQHGYPGASTKRIAALAGSAEPVLFAHFSSKLELFEVAIADAWSATAAEYLAADEAWADPTVQPALGRTIADLFTLLSDNRLSILALLEVELQGGERLDSTPDHRTALGQILNRFENRLATHPAHRPLGGKAHLALCTILGAAVLDAWVFTGRPPATRRLLHELENFLLYGITHPPLDAARDHPATGRRSDDRRKSGSTSREFSRTEPRT